MWLVKKSTKAGSWITVPLMQLPMGKALSSCTTRTDAPAAAPLSFTTTSRLRTLSVLSLRYPKRAFGSVATIRRSMTLTSTPAGAPCTCTAALRGHSLSRNAPLISAHLLHPAAADPESESEAAEQATAPHSTTTPSSTRMLTRTG